MVDVVVDPPRGSVDVGGVEVVDVVPTLDVVDVVDPDPDPDPEPDPDPRVPVFFGWIFGTVVVVVVVPVVPDGAAPSTCWACMSCWSMALMSDWYPARLPACRAAFAAL